MTNREFPTIMKIWTDIVNVMGNPANINADQEFNKKEFNKYYCDEKDIKRYYSQPEEPHKNAIVERFNRTLAQLLNNWRLATKQYTWYAVLNDIVNNYQNTYHKTIKAKPIDVWNNKD